MSAKFYSPISWLTNGLRPRLAALATAVLLAPAAWAQTPANDNCTGAIALTPGATCTVTTATNAGATASTGVAAPSCGGTTTTASNDVWYSVVVPAGGSVVVTTSAVTGSPFTDSVLELYAGTCGSLTSIGCNDDTGGNFSSVTATGQPAGSTIYARVFSYGVTATGQFGICATLPAAPAPVPANDNPSGAVALSLAATCTPVNGTNAGATTTTANGYANPGVAPNTCGIAVAPRDVWYTFTTAATGVGSTAATVQVTGNPAGYIRAFSSAAGAAGPFTEIACASGSAINTVSAPLNLTGLTPGATYYVFVAGYGSTDTQGAFTICVTSTPAIVCATPTAVSVGSITTTTASLLFTAGAGNTSYTVTYYPTATPAITTTVTPAPTASPVPLTGLTVATAYTVTLQPICSAGGTTGLITRTFTTRVLPPANDECATAVTLTPGAAGAACVTTSGTVAGATQSNAPIPCAGFTAATAQDVWYNFTATAASHTITVTGNFDGVMEVLSGACGTLTNVGCADASAGNNETLTLTSLTAGTAYRVRYYPYSANPTNGAFTICVTTLPANDAAVQVIYASGKVITASSQVVQVVVRNAGSAALTNLPVTLNVTGANTFADAKVVPSIAPGASATVLFAAFSPAAIGTNTLTVTVPADGLTTNNSQTYTQQVQATTFAIADPGQGATGGSVGFTASAGTVAGTGIFAVKYTTTAARTVSAINVWLGGAPASVGRTVYAVVLSSAGAILGRTPDYVIQTADIGAYKAFPFATPVAVPVGDFYAGFAQAASPAGTAPYFPLGLQTEVPTRTGTFYSTALTGVPAGGTPADAASNNLGRFMIEAVTNILLGTSAALDRSISMFPNPSSGQVTLDIQGARATGAMQVQITNVLGQLVHTAAVRDNTRNPLDLSGLADGLYLVRIITGSEYTIRQLVLTK
ncbi:MAG: T9SS type A sorting domain-containing protein [Hymenobacter sp.]|nr:T9SS type A sorting domain-containing protein [Hymenobacter sp.]